MPMSEERYRERMAAIGEIAAGIGHDLRNPLAAIGNALHFVARRLESLTVPDPRVVQFIEIAEKELGVCEQTIAALLELSRDAPLARSRTSMAVVLRDAIAAIEVPGHVTIASALPPDLPHVDADAALLRVVFANLLQNACEAMPAARPGKVTLSARAPEGEFVVEVADTGRGIAPEVRDRLFDPLFTTKSRGTGLGLAVVARIVARHGGRVDVESQPDVGTRVAVHLPR